MIFSSDFFENTPRKPQGYKVSPRKKQELIFIAANIRTHLQEHGLIKDNGNYVDAIGILENVCPRIGYQPHPVEDKLLPKTPAFVIPDQGLIVIKNSVYEDLFRDDSFARTTVIHEFAHLVLQHSLTLHRGAVLGEHEWYEDSEWQANQLMAELLMPVEVVQALGANPLTISKACGVGVTAAVYRLNKLKKDKRI